MILGKTNKKGIGTVLIIEYLFYFLLIAIILGIFVLIFNYVDSGLDVDVDVGQVNLRIINNQTFGQLNDAFTNSADNIGIILLLGMCLFLMLNAYFLGEKQVLWLVVDIFIIVFAFILAVYISQTYQSLTVASSIIDVFISDIPNVSKFVLNLPLIVPVLGALIMILSYSKLRKDRGEEEPNVLGF